MKKLILYFFSGISVFFLLLLLMLGLDIQSSLLQSAVKMPNKSHLYICLSNGLYDFPTCSTLGWGRHSKPNVWDIDRALRFAAHDTRVTSALIHMDFPILTFSQAYILGRSIDYFRSSGKKIKCYASSFGNLGGRLSAYFLATYCDEIKLQRMGEVAINSLNEEEVLGEGFFLIRDLLDKYKIMPDSMVRTRDKNSIEPLMQKTSSIENREMLSFLIKYVETQVLEGIIYNRASKLKEGVAVLKDGPYLDIQALDLGIIDDISNELESNERFVAVRDYIHNLEKTARKTKEVIAVVPLEGAIVDDGVAYGLREKVITPLYVKEIFERLHKQGNVRGVILSINSSGGSILASEKIWSLIKHFQAEYKIVVYMQGVVVSGGHYISAPAHYIVANPFTLCGSIDVLVGRFVLRKMLDDFGFSDDLLGASNVSINSTSSNFTQKQQTYLKKKIEHIYDRFVEIIIDGRQKSKEEILSLAEGCVWTGGQAVNSGLADQVGDLTDTIEHLVKLAELKPNSYRVELIAEKDDLSAVIKEILEQFDVLLNTLSRSLQHVLGMFLGPAAQHKENF